MSEQRHKPSDASGQCQGRWNRMHPSTRWLRICSISGTWPKYQLPTLIYCPRSEIQIFRPGDTSTKLLIEEYLLCLGFVCSILLTENFKIFLRISRSNKYL